jgi:hypothetical protein
MAGGADRERRCGDAIQVLNSDRSPQSGRIVRTMKHSRPGFSTRTNDQVPAKLNADMIPAIHRKPLVEGSTLRQEPQEHKLDERTEAAMKKLALEHPPAEILVNPTPSEPPKILEPGK